MAAKPKTEAMVMDPDDETYLSVADQGLGPSCADCACYAGEHCERCDGCALEAIEQCQYVAALGLCTRCLRVREGAA